jgi:translation initiation factor 2A
MSEDAQKSCSKAAKKNKKRHAKKPVTKADDLEKQTFDLKDMLAELKKQLEEAKLNKDHPRSATLRDQIWVLTDIIAGVKTAIPDDELDKIIETIHAQFHPTPKMPPSSTDSEVNTVKQPVAVTANPAVDVLSDDRKLRNLQKKLEQIKVLKDRQQRGEKLEANQIEKISSEEKVKEEIKELEDVLRGMMLKC